MDRRENDWAEIILFFDLTEQNFSFSPQTVNSWKSIFGFYQMQFSIKIAFQTAFSITMISSAFDYFVFALLSNHFYFIIANKITKRFRSPNTAISHDVIRGINGKRKKALHNLNKCFDQYTHYSGNLTLYVCVYIVIATCILYVYKKIYTARATFIMTHKSNAVTEHKKCICLSILWVSLEI